MRYATWAANILDFQLLLDGQLVLVQATKLVDLVLVLPPHLDLVPCRLFVFLR